MTANPPEPRYVLATPVRNEREILPDLVQSIADQEIQPAVWVIVDDGSDDGSRQWLEKRAERLPFLQVCASPESATEYLGGHIARIKRWGLEQALAEAARRGYDVEFAGVLDADVALSRDHYRGLLEAFAASPKLGVASSVLLTDGESGRRVEPYQRVDLPRGPTQFFRVRCLQGMGGLPPWPSFDSIANVKARALGFETRLLTHIVATHRRATATRFGPAAGYARKGRYAWFVGLHPLLVVARAAAYTHRPSPRAGYHFLAAYLDHALRRRERCPDQAVRKHYGWPRLAEVARSAIGLGPRYVSDSAVAPSAPPAQRSAASKANRGQ